MGGGAEAEFSTCAHRRWPQPVRDNLVQRLPWTAGGLLCLPLA
jgi:hypothetical protein